MKHVVLQGPTPLALVGRAFPKALPRPTITGDGWGALATGSVGGAAALDVTIAFTGERFSPAIAHAVRAHLAAPSPLGSEHQPGSPRILARRLPDLWRR